MTVILGILLTIFIFTVVVFIHEMGHFLTARFFKMRVHEFGIGIPPRAKVLCTDKKGTDYTLNWLPIGGFVRIKGEDPSDPDASDKDAFSHKTWYKRAIVLVAGVTMNFLLAWIILAGLFLSGVSPLAPNFFTEKDYNSYLIPSFEKSIQSGYMKHDGIMLSSLTGSVAQKSGIGTDMKLVSINGQNVQDIEVFRSHLVNNDPVTSVVRSNDTELSHVVVPDQGKIGVSIFYKDLDINREYKTNFGFVDALQQATWEVWTLSRLTADMLLKTLKNLIAPATPHDREAAEEMIAGPIGMGAGIVTMLEGGMTWTMFFMMVALLSLNLGVLNILPFPALDGGRLVSTSIISIVGRFTKKKKYILFFERYIHAIGMLLLLGLSLFIAFLDISKFFK